MLFLKKEGIRFLFHKKVINCLIKYHEIWKRGQFKQLKLLRFLRIHRKLEIAQKMKKKMARNEKTVARNTKSCLKVAELLVESINPSM